MEQMILRFEADAPVEEKQEFLVFFDLQPAGVQPNLEWRQMVVNITDKNWNRADLLSVMEDSIIESVLDPKTKEEIPRPRI